MRKSLDISEAKPLLVVVGPTAVGKTEVAIRLALELNGEVISADSRQVYRFMDIGTAKPSSEQRQQVMHHLVDFLEPTQLLSVAYFQQLTYETIGDILSRNRLPILVGGTGQYVKAIVQGWEIPAVPPNNVLRAELEGFADVYGSTSLYEILVSLDPSAAYAVDWRNVRRVVRAIEVIKLAGNEVGHRDVVPSTIGNCLQIGLTRSREELYARADARIADMLRNGLEDEVRSLREKGYDWSLPAMSSLGYIQFADYLAGTASLEEVTWRMKHDTRRFIRHQYNWFRLSDSSISWFDLGVVTPERIIHFARMWLESLKVSPS